MEKLSKILVLVLVLLVAGPVRASEPSGKRQYPGGRDEEDLKVQEELKRPALKTDRRSIETQVLRNDFKKDVVLPSVPSADDSPEHEE